MERLIHNADMEQASNNLSKIAKSLTTGLKRGFIDQTERTILTSQSKVQCIECRRWFPMKEMIELDILGSGEYMCQDCKGDN